MRRLILIAFTVSIALSAADFEWSIPAGFPQPYVPSDNPMTAAKVELGRYLFYDTRMSVNGTQSCATCHRQELAFTDGKARAVGATGQVHPRGSMSLVNVAYAPSLTWANPTLDRLEEQALVPMLGEDPIELGLKGREQQFLDTIQADPVYQDLFTRAYSGAGERYTLAHVTQALAAFQRSIVSMRSPYDRYRWGGDRSAISDAAKRGELLFSSGERAACFQCHGGWNFAAVRAAQDTPRGNRAMTGFFNTGVSGYAAPNRGLFEITRQPEDIGKFRPPTLRNIAVTAPYMHDGSIATLAGVIDHYAAGGRMPHPNKTPVLQTLTLTESEKADLIAFLESLTDEELLHDPRWSDPWPAARAAETRR